MNKGRRTLSLMLTGTAVLPSCSDGIDVAEWTEEVRLHDGRMVTVWRRARAVSSGFPVSHRGANIDTEFKYEPMGVHWKGSLSRHPISFELFDGVPYLVLSVSDREWCRGKAPTEYRAQFFRWSSGQWFEVPREEFATDRALLNLATAYWGRTKSEDYKGLMSWEGKQLMGNRNPIDTIKTFFERGSRFCRIYDKI